MTIIVTGGGSGGHITPVLAVAAEIKKLRPDCTVVFIGPKGDKLMDVPKNDPNIDSYYSVSYGKLRRYHSEGWRQLLNLKVQSANINDLFKIAVGVFEAWKLLGKIKPAAVFTRGGAASVPTAVAAWLRGIPYITHDSDSTPSLANRLIAPGATKHIVPLDPSNYPYKLEKTVRIGVPVSPSYYPVTKTKQQQFLKEIGLMKYKRLILVTGGGNGSKVLNKIVMDNAGYLLAKYADLAIVHLAGREFAESLNDEYTKSLPKEARERVKVFDFINELYKYSGAATVVIARGGATNLAEFALQGKACIIIPSKQLIWNVKNAQAMAAEQAIIELSEEHAEQERRLASVVIELLDNAKRREALIKKFVQFATPNASLKIAKVILNIADRRTENT